MSIWGRFFSVLGDVGYSGPVCIEAEDRAYEGSLESRQAALVQSGRFLKELYAIGDFVKVGAGAFWAWPFSSASASI